MSKDFILASTKGCRIITEEADFLIDPAEYIYNVPDAVIFSSLRTAYMGYDCTAAYENIPIFTSVMTKKLMSKAFSAEEPTKCSVDDIIDCRLRTKNRLRKKGNVAGEFTFYGCSDFPGAATVLVKTESNSILYLTGEVPSKKALPIHDVLLINAQKKAPFEAIIKKVPEFSVEITDFSKIYDVLRYFNDITSENVVGIDDTVVFAACEYLKLDCTVFSKVVKPLTAFKSLPPVILTANPSLYKNRLSINASAFLPGISLSDIYRLASESHARQIIAVCPEFTGLKKRKNLTICGNNTLIEV